MLRLRDQTATETADVELTVELTKPDVAVKWMKNGSTLEPSERVKFVTDGVTHKVVISGVQKSDVEQYLCVLPDGKKSKAMLTVEGSSSSSSSSESLSVSKW